MHYHTKPFDTYKKNPPVKFFKKARLTNRESKEKKTVKGVTVYQNGLFGYLSKEGGWIISAFNIYKLQYKEKGEVVTYKHKDNRNELVKFFLAGVQKTALSVKRRVGAQAAAGPFKPNMTVSTVHKYLGVGLQYLHGVKLARFVRSDVVCDRLVANAG